MAAIKWYLARNQQKIGPFSSYQLKQLVSVHFLDRADLVLAEGTTKWTEASSIPGLFPQTEKKQYWLSHAGRTRGPFVVDQLKAGLATREWGLDAKIWTDESGEVIPLSQLPEMKEFVPSSVRGSHAQLLTGSLQIEEATLHLEGKKGDEIANLISHLMDLKRILADNPRIVEKLDRSIIILKTRRQELEEKAGG